MLWILKLSACVFLLLKFQCGPRNFIYQEMDRAPRKAHFKITHTYYKWLNDTLGIIREKLHASKNTAGRNKKH